MERRVDLTREFNAPRDLVFDAWVDPDQMVRWRGPEGFDTPRDRVNVDLRSGGRLDVVMVVTDPGVASDMGVEVGTEFPTPSVIGEVVIPDVISLQHEPMPDSRVYHFTDTRVEFHEEGDGLTRVDINSGPFEEQVARQFEVGWNQQFDKLDQVLRPD